MQKTVWNDTLGQYQQVEVPCCAVKYPVKKTFGRRFLDALKDGATLNPVNLKKVIYPAGYMVGVTNNQVKPENIALALQDVAAIARQKKNTFVGVWYDSAADVWFIDLSVMVADQAQALRMAATYQQQAIFNWSTMDCIYLDSPAAKVAEK